MPETKEIKGDFFKPKTASDWMNDALENLEDVSFKFACFVDHFKKSLQRAGVFDEDKTR